MALNTPKTALGYYHCFFYPSDIIDKTSDGKKAQSIINKPDWAR
jgi:hypothetical protein